MTADVRTPDGGGGQVFVIYESAHKNPISHCCRAGARRAALVEAVRMRNLWRRVSLARDLLYLPLLKQ